MRVVRGEQMRHNARGAGWHTKQKAQGLVPEGLRGLDQEATWSKSHSAGWVDGHGSCGMGAPSPCLLGAFTYMRHSAHEATRLWWETGPLRGMVDTVMMDRKADDTDLLFEFQRQRKMTLVTTPRRHSEHTDKGQEMMKVQNLPKTQRLRTDRGQTVEPMHGLVKEIFARDGYWMHGGRHNRWLCAAMEGAVQMPPLLADKQGRAPWKIKQEVLGR
jgi:hypothetical protein